MGAAIRGRGSRRMLPGGRTKSDAGGGQIRARLGSSLPPPACTPAPSRRVCLLLSYVSAPRSLPAGGRGGAATPHASATPLLLHTIHLLHSTCQWRMGLHQPFCPYRCCTTARAGPQLVQARPPPMAHRWVSPAPAPSPARSMKEILPISLPSTSPPPPRRSANCSQPCQERASGCPGMSCGGQAARA